jgi:hypothetical protein
MIKNIKKTNSGDTLVEIIFYVALFAILAVVLLDVMISMTGFFMKTMTNGDIVQGSSIMENVSRDLKQANNFSFVSNVLTINTKDDSSNPKTITYTYSSPNIQITDSVLGNLGNLNTPSVAVNNFNVTLINTLRGKAAQINLTIESNRDAESYPEDFEDTVILRGSY